MKTFILLSVLMSGTSFAQTLDVTGLKNLMTDKKESLEKVNVGMSKKLITTGKMIFPTGECGYMLTSTQHILKVEAEKVIVYAKEKFSPAATPICAQNGQTASSEEITVYYEAKPTLAADFADLDASAANIKSILQEGEIVTLTLGTQQRTTTGQTVIETTTIKYDLAQPSFKNTLLTQGNVYKTVSENLADVDVLTIDLTKVFFCSNNDQDNSDCVEGNYSDIVY